MVVEMVSAGSAFWFSMLVGLCVGLVFLHEASVIERDFAAGENGPFDLPVNPVSFLMLHCRFDAAAGAPDFQQLLGHVQSVVVSFKGTSIVNLSGLDLARLVHHLWGRRINIEGFNAVAPAQVAFSIPIPFSRKPYWSKECFPATRRGEFTLTITRSAALTNVTVPRFAVESVQLLEAEPSQFLKLVTLSRAINAGDLDMELPIGNPFLGLQLFSPTAILNAPISETVRRFRLLLDEVEFDIGNAAFDVYRSIGQLRGSDFDSFAAPPSIGRNYAYADFDPLMDESFMVETEGRAHVKLRFESDVAGTVRVIPVELVRLPGAGGGA